MKNLTAALIFVVATCVSGAMERAEGQLHWPDPPKKALMRVRLVAVSLADPRSSFFSSHEVLIAETQVGDEEWGLIKLVYTFLPYQPRLTETGFDYSVVHELTAWRDSGCDETVAQMTARDVGRRHAPLTFAVDSPREDLARRRSPLPCYETTADDYGSSFRHPIGPPPPPPPEPRLKTRPQPSRE
jgi:hypothetical protein